MADNTTLSQTGSSGDTIRTIDRTTYKTPVSGLDVGGASAEALIGDSGVFMPVEGAAAENAAAAGNPVLAGGRYDASSRTLGDGDAGAVALNVNGGVVVTQVAIASGGATTGRLISAATTNATSVKASAGTLYSLSISSIDATPVYVKFYDKASAPTVGTDTPVLVVTVPGSTVGATIDVPIPTCGLNFPTGIAFATTTGITDADTTAVSADEVLVNYSYK